MKTTNAIPAMRGFVCAVLLGICLFGIPLAFYGAWDAWNEPVVLDGKNRGEEQTVLGRTTEGGSIGVFVGGIAGTIAGIGVAAKRLLF
jgi:hypothetical protein